MGLNRRYLVAVSAAAVAGAAIAYAAAGGLTSSEEPVPPAPVGDAQGSPTRPAIDLDRAREILAGSADLARFGELAEMAMGEPIPWYGEDGLLGVQFELSLPAPLSGSYEFIVSQYREDDGGSQPYDRFRLPLTVAEMDSLWLAIDLRNGLVVELAPGDGTEIVEQGDPIPE